MTLLVNFYKYCCNQRSWKNRREEKVYNRQKNQVAININLKYIYIYIYTSFEKTMRKLAICDDEIEQVLLLTLLELLQ